MNTQATSTKCKYLTDPSPPQVVPLPEAPIPDHYVDDGQGNQPTDKVKGVDPGHGEEEGA